MPATLRLNSTPDEQQHVRSGIDHGFVLRVHLDDAHAVLARAPRPAPRCPAPSGPARARIVSVIAATIATSRITAAISNGYTYLRVQHSPSALRVAVARGHAALGAASAREPEAA